MSTLVPTRDPVAALTNERDGILLVERLLQADEHVSLLVDDSGERTPLPASLRQLLLQVAGELLRGNRVSVMPVATELTTQQAADLLNVSRPYLIRLLERGDIPFDRTGTHRRIKLADVLAYRRQRSVARREMLREMAREAIELNLPQ